MHDALIGYTGFVGGTLLSQRPFAATFRASNVADMCGRSFDTLYCAGAPGQKWLANQNPQQDAANLALLMESLAQVRCRRLVLLSTVDVFARPIGVDEHSPVPAAAPGYGANRRQLEVFVQQRFENFTIVRLPALVGEGLRKNALYDLKHGNRVDQLRGDAVFQFYPMRHLWRDLQRAAEAHLPIIHLSAEPVRLGALAKQAFGVGLQDRPDLGAAPYYDLQSCHTALWGKRGRYAYEQAEVYAAVGAYAQTPPAGGLPTIPPPPPAGAHVAGKKGRNAQREVRP